MPRLRSVRTKEEADAVPEDQSISVIIDPAGAPSEVKVDGEQTQETKPSKPAVETQEVIETEISEPEDDRESLKKRLEEARNAERVALELAGARQRELEEAVQLSRSRENELSKSKSDTAQAQYDMVINALAAAQAESDAAQRDWEAAAAEGDVRRQSEANIKSQRAQARMIQYEDYKVSLENHQKDQKEKETELKKNPPQHQDPIERAVQGLPDAGKVWLRSHPEYLTDARKNAQIQFLHHESVAQGHQAFTQPYFEWIEGQLGMRQKETDGEDERNEERSENRRERAIVSAPVSREAPSLRDGRPVTSRVTLSPEQRSAAKIAGISEIEYAKQLIRLAEAKKQGLLQ